MVDSFKFPYRSLGAHNVRDYGARGDGTGDDTAAIQAAIDDAGAFQFILAPPGTYPYTTLALNGNGLVLRGAGYGATFLKQTANGDGLTINVGGAGQISNVAVSDLTLGASADRTSGAAIRLGYAGFVNIRNVRIANALGGRPYEGLRIDRGSDVHCANLRVQGCASHGAVLQPGSAASVIVEVYFDGECEFRSGLADGMLMLMDQAYSAGVCSLEGVHSAATYYNNALAGCRIKATVAGASPRNIHFNGATFDSNAGSSTTAGSVDAGLVAETTDIAASIRRLHICLAGAWSSFNSNDGIFIGQQVRDFTICCGEVRSNGAHGVNVQNAIYGAVRPAAVVDNSRNANNTSYGVNLGGTAQYVTVETSFDNTDDQATDQRGVGLGSAVLDLDLSRCTFRNQQTGTVPRINGGGAAGNLRIALPRGGVSAVQTGAYAVPPEIDVVRCDTTSAGFTVTLPRAANFPDREIVVKRTAGANTVTVAATAGTVETTSVTTTPVRHRSDGTNWVAL